MNFLQLGRIVRAAPLAVLISGLSGAIPLSATEAPVQPGYSLSGNYLAGRVAATDHDTENASIFFREAIRSDPDNTRLKIRAFPVFIGNGDFEEGAEIARNLVEGGHVVDSARIVVGVEQMLDGDFAAATKQFDGRWRESLDRLITGIMRAWARVGDGKSRLALTELDAIRGPNWYDLFLQYHGGLIALNAGDTKDAIRRLEKGFANRAAGQASSHTYMRIVRALAHAHSVAGNNTEALQMLSAAADLQPQNPVFEKLSSEFAEGKGVSLDIPNAKAGGAEILMNVGTALNTEGGGQFSRRFLQLASELAPNSEVVRIQLADLFDQQELTGRANEIFSTISSDSPYYRIAQLEIALNLNEAGNLVAAEDILQRLVDSKPDDMTATLSYGAVLARHEKFAKAAPIYQNLVDRIAEPRRHHWMLFYRLGIAHERTKQWPKAEAAFRKALELSPNQPNVLNYLGYSWVDMNINLKEGLEMIRTAVRLRPTDGYMVDSLGWAHYRLGEYEKAVEELERAVALRPADPTINDHLGDAYWYAGRKLEAMFQWSHALSLDPPADLDASKIEEKLAKGLPDKQPKKVEKQSENKPDQG